MKPVEKKSFFFQMSPQSFPRATDKIQLSRSLVQQNVNNEDHKENIIISKQEVFVTKAEEMEQGEERNDVPLEAVQHVVVDEVYPDNLANVKTEAAEGHRFSCSLCDFETFVEDEIKLHMESHEICMVFSCKHCNYQAASKSSLRFHLVDAHEDLCHKCKACSYKATTYGALARHMRSVHRGEKYPCNLCDYEATQKSNLKTHITRVHGLQN